MVASLLIACAVLWAQSAEAANTSPDFNQTALDRVASPPLGLPKVSIPTDNPLSVEKIALGRKLFFDRRLSRNRTMSCGMCHIPEQGFTSNEVATPIGVGGQSLRRNAPSSYNVAYLKSMFHDARDSSLETQIFGPLLARNEMANPSLGFVLATLREASDYQGLFERAFGGPVNPHNLGLALASYERTLVSGNAPFDRWQYGGNENAVSGQVKQGFALFTGKAGCAACHLIGDDSALFTDHKLHNTGIGAQTDTVTRSSQQPVPVEIAPGIIVPLARKVVTSVGLPRQRDLGRQEVTNDPADLYLYKTPMLRNVALTAPYMHNGALPTLQDVVRFYNQGGHPNPGLDPLVQPLNLSENEIHALITFLKSLTGDNVGELQADGRSTVIGN